MNFAGNAYRSSSPGTAMLLYLFGSTCRAWRRSSTWTRGLNAFSAAIRPSRRSCGRDLCLCCTTAARRSASCAPPPEKLEEILSQAVRQDRTVHLLPQTRPENVLKIWRWPRRAAGRSAQVHLRASSSARGRPEVRQVGGGDRADRGGPGDLSRNAHHGHATDPPGCSRAETPPRSTRSPCPTACDCPSPPSSPGTANLHNPCYENTLEGSDIVSHDSAAESPLHYAGDITRTIPHSGRFRKTEGDLRHRADRSQERAITAAKPGVEWREVHWSPVRFADGGPGRNWALQEETRRRRWRPTRIRCSSPAVSVT